MLAGLLVSKWSGPKASDAHVAMHSYAVLGNLHHISGLHHLPACLPLSACNLK